MKKNLLFFFLFVCFKPFYGQGGFQFEKGVDKVVIPFKFINNLIFIPIQVNGVELFFLLDSGVDETLLFSMEQKKEVSFTTVEKVILKGLGNDSSVEGLKIRDNVLNCNGLISENHLLYVILDESFNLSSHIGIPVNGIIGHRFFKTNLVEINFSINRITVYRDIEKYRKRVNRKYQAVPITIEKSKPYIETVMLLNGTEITTKLLIDVGNSDSVWLFENPDRGITIPQKNYDDYIGKGFSGDIEGKKAKIDQFLFSKYKFNKPIVSFPDSISLKHLRLVDKRAGSVGSEILKRFNLVFDYSKSQLFIKKNNKFHDPFRYNKSGIEVKHEGMQWVPETFRLQTVAIVKGNNLPANTIPVNDEHPANDFKYKFTLKPIYMVSNVRKNSAAALSGLQKGDLIVSINNKPGHEFTLGKINLLLSPEEEKWITFEVERNNQILKFNFKLFDVLK